MTKPIKKIMHYCIYCNSLLSLEPISKMTYFCINCPIKVYYEFYDAFYSQVISIRYEINNYLIILYSLTNILNIHNIPKCDDSNPSVMSLIFESTIPPNLNPFNINIYLDRILNLKVFL